MVYAVNCDDTEKGTAKISAMETVKSVQVFVKLTEDEIVKTLADNQENFNLSQKKRTLE